MGSRLGGRVVHFANLPIKLLMPAKLTNIHEFALKTIPSASKIEIKRVLESLYGFDVEKVNTLNMDGKKKKRGGLLIAKADYKKAYVTLRTPLSISRDLFPVKFIEEDRKSKVKGSSFVEEEDDKKSHWLDRKEKREIGGYGKGKGRRGGERANSPTRAGAAAAAGMAKFPWSNMRFVGK
ncbi:unnamed protein product [Arabidopsis lyrata]|uniref:uncharacterized protein LOC9302963 isoform X2 n=1 Tax=Arabidopsis lyrata subsp. lyrata TaxID=81972 RepID=UPI000A29C829|nr:uncharacterized protein LOC9302963 isoform X2 [Arabidopsis lyrata subsp. lyrata]CAH8273892.1 unnamed protein product [Arabidopsis lyrata]|eukprot:XP_002866891.2 uncharacterized protein LOC9302963 isoform X2 [Arabidopsis lyrata subsp. lyrata]